ncbi:MAG: DUF2235 domain-containing protein [Pseudomonadota bacterium]
MFNRLRALLRFWRWVRRWRRPVTTNVVAQAGPKRPTQHHFIILDGTLSSLQPGRETNAGLTYKLLREVAREQKVSLYYEPGLQWYDWRSGLDVIVGRGINRQIRRAYSVLSSRYRPGDKITLIGYSRGAFAVRSLGGIVSRVGLLRYDCATERAVRTAYRHYQLGASPDVIQAFSDAYCHKEIEIEMVGVWDTVKALGLKIPGNIARTEAVHAFHDDRLSNLVRHGFQALALNEKRAAFSPILWISDPNWTGHALEQVWFRGHHGDIGGHQAGYSEARPLANIPLVWMLEKILACGTKLPEDWQSRFVQDPNAPSAGLWRGPGIFAWRRKIRRVGADVSEQVHNTVPKLEAEARLERS